MIEAEQTKSGAGARTKIIVLSIIVAGTMAGAFGITSFEHRYNSDFYQMISMRMLFNRMAPGFYIHPSLYFDLVAGLYYAYYLFLKATGQVADLIGFVARCYADPAPVFALSRIPALAAYAGLIGVSARLGRRLWGARAGVLAAIFAAGAPQIVGNIALGTQYSGIDALETFLIVLFFDELLSAIEAPQRLVRAGLLLGLSVSANYPAAICGVFLLAAPMEMRRAGQGGAGLWKKVVTAFAVALAAFAITSPYALIHAKDFMRDIAFQSGSVLQASEGREIRGTDPLYYLRFLFSHDGGLLLFAIPAIAVAALKRGRERTLIAFILLYGATFQLLRTKEARWMLPVLPFLWLFAARAIDGALAVAARRRAWPAAIAVCAVGAWCAWSVYCGFIAPGRRAMAAKVLPVEAAAWLRTHAEKGGKVVYEAGTVYLRTPEELLKNNRDATRFRDVISAALFQARDRLEPDVPFELIPMTNNDTMGAEEPYSTEYLRRVDPDWIALNGVLMTTYAELDRLTPGKYARVMRFYSWVKRNYREARSFRSDNPNAPAGVIVFRRKAAVAERRTAESAGQGLFDDKMVSLHAYLEGRMRGEGDFRGTMIAWGSEGGTTTLELRIPNVSEGAALRVRIFESKSMERCYGSARGMCIQFYSRRSPTAAEERMLQRIVEMISEWKRE